MAEAPTPDRVLGFDFGHRRTGVAVGNRLSCTSEALVTLDCDQGMPWDRVAALIEQWQPDALVVGLPLDLDGAHQAMTIAAERFARRLEGRFGLPCLMADERFSTVTAGTDPQQHGRDAAAARQILLAWFAERSAADARAARQNPPRHSEVIHG